MNPTKFSLDNSRLIITFFLLICIGGFFCFTILPRAKDPDYVVRTAIVRTEFPGASVERVEELVTEKIEKHIQEIPEIDYISSQSKTGVSLVYVTIKESYKNMRPIWDDLRNKVDDAKPELPDTVVGPFVWDDFGDVFGIVIAITSDGFEHSKVREIAKDLQKELLVLSQVAKVDMYGDQEERVFIEITNARLARLGLTPGEIIGLLQKENIVLPGGFVNVATDKVVIEPSGIFQSLDDIAKTVIALPGNEKFVNLEDIATVKRAYKDPPSVVMHFDGKSSIGLAVSMEKGGNLIKLGQDIRKILNRYYEECPIGIDFNFVNYEPMYVENALNEFNNNLMQGVALVILIMLIFMGLRTGIIVATLLPMTILGTYIMMYFLGIHLQRVSIASLIIAIGMIVDCGIVMCDSILVRLRSGESKRDCCINSGAELNIPILTSTLTTCAAFLPIALAKSEVGEYCFSLFAVVSIALLWSWILALTMIPFLAASFLSESTNVADVPYRKKFVKTFFSNKFVKVVLVAVCLYICVVNLKIPWIIMAALLPFMIHNLFFQKNTDLGNIDQDEQFKSAGYIFYKKFLVMLLNNRAKAVSAFCCIFVISMLGFIFVNKIFFPPSDRPQFYINFTLPEGTNINSTLKSVAKLEEFLKTKEEITSFTTYIGTGGPRFYLSYNPEQNAENYAFILANVKNSALIGKLCKEIREFIYKEIPEVEPTVSPFEDGPIVGAPIQIRISGKDKDVLYGMAEDVKKILAVCSGTTDIKTDWGSKRKKIVIDVNQTKAKYCGISSQDIAYSLQNQLSGIVATDFREKDELIPIIIRSPEAYNKKIEELDGLNVYSYSSNKNVSLRQIAKLNLVWEHGKIYHRDRVKTITVSSYLLDSYASKVLKEADPKIKELAKTWPFGYSFKYGGESEDNNKAQNSINNELPMALFIIAILLIWQFNSFKKMLIIIITIPMALIGVVIGLLVTRSDFGFMATLGVISLGGVVVNNAIILIDRIQIERSGNKKSDTQAIVDAAIRRTRPIFLTTITTIAGLIPLAIGGGVFWAPMAYVIMFGLMFSTVLTLGLIPVLYSLFFKIKIESIK